MNMERKNSIGRFSLSTTNIPSPIAESTQINGSTMQTRFQWGGSAISPNKTLGSSSIANGTTNRSQKVTMSPISKIDPRIYTDVQSNGLASRIVKYHETSTRMNRSQSTGNLYNKPGQFPIVHLKKTELSHKPNRNQNLSMVRIAPPDKSAFQGNTLSGILRSGSVVPTVCLKKANEDISHENRPILHPPPTENDMAPTRSVLEVLKEISRKRIISDELDGGNESVKKYCKEYEIDTPRTHNAPPVSNQNNHISVIAKRQREAPSSPNSKQSEQAVKKRMYSRNNDILSSLSSSLVLMTPKRKNLPAGDSPNSSPEGASRPPQAKQQCSESIYPDLSKIPHSFHAEPITPLPPTPAIAENLNRAGGEPLRTASEPIFSTNGPKPSKPKLTLFNTDYEVNTARRTTIREEPNDSDGLSKIQFIKPKKSSSVTSAKNPLIERAQKSKLALMLSGLKGELDLEDEVDSGPSKDAEIVAVPQASLSFGTTTTAATFTIPSPVTISKTTSLLIGQNGETPVAATSVKTSSTTTPATTVDTPKATTSSELKLGTAVISSQPPATSTSAAATVGFAFEKNTTTPATAPVSTQSIVTKPATGGFAFGALVATATTTTTASQPTKSLTFSSSVVATSASIAPQLSGSNVTAAITSKPAVFGATTAASTTAPQFGTVTPASKETTKPPAFGATSTATTMPSASFGGFMAPNATLQFGSATTAPTTLQSSFGGFGTAAAATTTAPSSFGSSATFRSTAISKPAPPAFGSPTTSTVASTFGTTAPPAFGAPNKPLMAFGTPTTTTNTAVLPAFGTSTTSTAVPSFAGLSAGSGFGAPQKPTATFAAPSAFGSSAQFGGNTATTFGAPTAAAPNSTVAPSGGTFSFSGAGEAKPSSGGFSFSGNTATTTAQSAAPFSFGGAVPTTAAANGTNNATGSAFSFSSLTAAKPAPGGFAFGGGNESTGSSVFGAGTSTNTENKPSSFSFGGSAAPPQQNSAPTKSFSFQTSSTANNTGGAPAAAAPTGGFSFSGATPATGSSENKNVFGSVNSATKPASFSFGGNATAANTPAIFGASSGIANSTGPAASSTNLFASATTAPAQQNNAFNFGGASTVAAPAAGSANLFGTASSATTTSLFGAPPSQTTNKPDTKSFSFGGNSTSNNNGFGFAGATANNQTATNQPQAFSFGGAAPAQQQTSNAAQASNLFANAAAPKATAFNFSSTPIGGGSSAGGDTNINNVNVFGAAGTMAPQGASNPFSPSPVPGGTNERPIRRATRRLQK